MPQVARGIHGGHAPARDLALDRVAAIEGFREGDRTWLVRQWRLRRRCERRGGWLFQEVLGHTLVRGEKRLHLAAQGVVFTAGIPHEALAPVGLAHEGALEDHVDHTPTLGRHRWPGTGLFLLRHGFRHEHR